MLALVFFLLLNLTCGVLDLVTTALGLIGSQFLVPCNITLLWQLIDLQINAQRSCDQLNYEMIIQNALWKEMRIHMLRLKLPPHLLSDRRPPLQFDKMAATLLASCVVVRANSRHPFPNVGKSQFDKMTATLLASCVVVRGNSRHPFTNVGKRRNFDRRPSHLWKYSANRNAEGVYFIFAAATSDA